jgi:hypothetical protein
MEGLVLDPFHQSDFAHADILSGTERNAHHFPETEHGAYELFLQHHFH